MERKGPPLEIERKFLIDEPPPGYDKFEVHHIIQGYVPLASDNRGLRIRRMDGRFFETIKMPISGDSETGDKNSISRIEVEIELSRMQFDALWELAGKHSIEKDRFEIPYGDYIIELDIYKGQLSGFFTAEVEFNSEKEAFSFNQPSWFGIDVSRDLRYSNQSLAFNGLPGKSSL